MTTYSVPGSRVQDLEVEPRQRPPNWWPAVSSQGQRYPVDNSSSSAGHGVRGRRSKRLHIAYTARTYRGAPSHNALIYRCTIEDSEPAAL